MMRIEFDLPDPAEQLLLRLATCIRVNSQHAPSVNEIARSLVMEVLIDDAVSHGVVGRPDWSASRSWATPAVTFTGTRSAKPMSAVRYSIQCVAAFADP